MPSWNIHTGLVEHVLAPGDAATLGIRDANLFLFGNLVPDIYVGYMAPDVSHTLRYIDTHYGQPTHIPVPEVGRFWDDWVAPAIPQGGVDDVVLGAWAHLLADNRYNACVRTFNEARSIPSGERTRIAKQGDFDLFGHSLGISSTVEVTPALVAAAARFPSTPSRPRTWRAPPRPTAPSWRPHAGHPSAPRMSCCPRPHPGGL